MSKTRVNITLSDQILARIDELAGDSGLKRSSFVSMVLKQYIDQQDVLKAVNNDSVKGAPEQMTKVLDEMKSIMEKISKIESK